jgi:hypothetical protein
VMFYASGAADADCVGLFLSGEVRKDFFYLDLGMCFECAVIAYHRRTGERA